MKKIAFLIFLLCLVFPLKAQHLDKQWILDNYTKREEMIAMRDGVRLSTAIYEPRIHREGGSPIMLTRTPYGIKPYGEGYASDLASTYKYYVQNGYIIVYQSVRGTYLSEGEYVNIRPLDKDRSDISDSFDTIEWLVHNTDNNGSVGVKGVSYPGYYSTIAALCGHPALKAVSPQAPVSDWFMGDDFGHNGEIMMIDAFLFGSGFLPRRTRISEDGGKARVEGTGIDKENVYEYFLDKGSLEEVFRPWSDTLEFWNGRMEHPTYDRWWKVRNPNNFLRKDMPAMMVVGGLYDAEDCYGAYDTYRALLEKTSSDVYFVTGPWSHGAHRSSSYNHLDDAWFGEGISEYYFKNVEYPFFAYYLEGKGKRPSAVTFLPSGETAPSIAKGKKADDRWVRMDSWAGGESRGFGFGGKSYVCDPDNPVPYYHKVFRQTFRDKEYMAGDQRGLESRKDVATWRYDVLTDTLALAGPVTVHLKLKQTCTDADYIVKLIDERPDGYQMLVRADVMPTRFYKGFDKERPVTPDKEFSLDFTMPDIAHIFMPGHRVMIQVQSTWFPLVARRPASRDTMTVLKGSYLEVPELAK